MRKLTARQERFVSEYLKDANGTQAAIRAGFSPNGANVTASKLLTHPHIASALATLRKAEVQEHAGLSLREHVGELARLRKVAEDGGEVNAAITAEVARGRALGHQAGTYRPNLDDLTEAELEQVKQGELPPKLRLA